MHLKQLLTRLTEPTKDDHTYKQGNIHNRRHDKSYERLYWLTSVTGWSPDASLNYNAIKIKSKKKPFPRAINIVSKP